MTMRRVVVTGMGMVTPLGCGVEPTWQRLIAGKSGARKIEKFDVSDLPAKIACQIPRGDGSEGTYDPELRSCCATGALAGSRPFSFRGA
jgi:3-oxoacyl-[acyl-carrier-protein] synthase II